MALINCVECGKQMSDQAAACPHCGHPNPAFAEPKTDLKAELEEKAKASREKSLKIAYGRIAENPNEKPVQRFGCVTGCLTLIVGICILAIIGSFNPDQRKKSAPTPSKKSIPQVEKSWVPEGFKMYNSQIAFRWSPKGSYTCRYNRCSQMEVVARNGCRSLYAEVTKLDANDNNVGYTNDTTTNLGSGQKAILKFNDYGRVAKSFSIAKINCL